MRTRAVRSVPPCSVSECFDMAPERNHLFVAYEGRDGHRVCGLRFIEVW